MFAKTFKMKSYNSLKGSTRKNLVQKISKMYPHLTEEDFAELIPVKASLSLMKVITFNQDEYSLHIVDNVPIIIEKDDYLSPTIFGMWKCPYMLPSVTISPALMGRIKEGNYNVSKNHIFQPPSGHRWPSFRKGGLVSVNMKNNKASVLVGVAVYASCDIPLVQMGQCVKTIQILGDLLCNFDKFTKIDRPNLDPPYPENSAPCEEIVNALEKVEITADESPQTNGEVGEEKMEEADVISPTDEMDSLLKYCLLCVLKTEGKKIQLPIKTNLLYANGMASFCPPDKSLDVKKSSYKKMGKFLEEIEKEGILQVKPIEKGVDAVLSVNHDHPSIKSHVISSDVNSNSKSKKDDSSLSLKDIYKVTAAVVPLFARINLKKGDTVPPSTVHAVLQTYIKINNMQDPQNKNLVILDPALTKLINAKSEKITHEELKSEVLKKMTHCTEMAFSDGSSVINTGKTPMITMQVDNRSGNKKVTIVSNVHFYGVNINTLSKECQHGVAASCTITKQPGSKFDQLQIQGDQTYFITKHLIEVYGVPKRVISQADKYLKKQKK